MAYKRGEPRVCAMVRAPTPEEEDHRRACRERNALIGERVAHVIREGAVTSAAHADGRMLPGLVTTDNTSSQVWADSAYRSQRNEKCLASKMLVSRIHRRKPAGKPMPQHIARANAAKSSIRARIEHVFAHQKSKFGLFIRTIGLARAEAKLTLANLAYNFDRLIFHERARAMGGV